VLLAAFGLIQIKVARTPLVPFGLFRSRAVSGANLVMLLIGAAFFSMWYFLSLYLQNVLGHDALKAGMAFLPMGLTIIVGAQISALGVLFAPLASAATSGVPYTEAGLASGVLNTSRQMGGSIGLAALATVAIDRTHSVLGSHGAVGAALTSDYARAFTTASFLCLAAFLAALIVPSIRPPRTQETEARVGMEAA
jgi:hypothetical protein